MTKIIKKTLKWLVAMFGVIIVLLLLIIGVLSNPGLFFPEEKQYESIMVYSEKPIGQETDSIMSEVLLRLDKIPIYNRDKNYNLSLCSTQKKFTFFSRLTVRANRIMGFCILGSAFVNEDFINELGMKTQGKPKYLTREGSVVHVATHELMHAYINNAYGSFRARTLPNWKIEGYCEYGVNQFVAPSDSGYTIHERIDIYLDDSMWNPTAKVHRPHYIWGLMMEYLINVKGLSFEQVMDNSILKENVYQEMMNWRKSIIGNTSQVFKQIEIEIN
ncbi:MAG: hypothetical protein HKN68_14710 [Saprospiraceae bacterium]|nr:hypothetical protein [Saprospiraceae bacterium]